MEQQDQNCVRSNVDATNCGDVHGSTFLKTTMSGSANKRGNIDAPEFWGNPKHALAWLESYKRIADLN